MLALHKRGVLPDDRASETAAPALRAALSQSATDGLAPERDAKRLRGAADRLARGLRLTLTHELKPAPKLELSSLELDHVWVHLRLFLPQSFSAEWQRSVSPNSEPPGVSRCGQPNAVERLAGGRLGREATPSAVTRYFSFA